mgnify:CR=1 FL=1
MQITPFRSALVSFKRKKKAFISDNEEGYGDFEGVSTNSTEYSLRYTPYDLETFDIDFKAFSNISLGTRHGYLLIIIKNVCT